MDKLLVNVPSIEELEEGHTNLIYLGDDTLVSSTTNDKPDAIYEPLSKMWMGSPIPVLDERSDSTVANEWTISGSSIIACDDTDIGKGIQMVTESLTNGWTLTSDEDKIIWGRGYFIDFLMNQPTNMDKAQLPLTFFWGTFSEGSVIYKFKLEISSNENGAAIAAVFERNLDKPEEEEWRKYGSFQFLNKDFFGKRHRIWLQPVTQYRFIIKNVENGAGIVVKTFKPSTREVEVENDANIIREFTWTDSKFKVKGWNTGFVTLRDLEYSYDWQILQNNKTDIGYESTTDFQIETSWYAPDNLGSETVWESDFNIWNQNDEDWQGTGGQYYYWDWRLTGEADGTLTGTNQRTPTMSDIKLKLPRVSQSNGLSPTDLIASNSFCVNSLSEIRSLDDMNSTLTFTVEADRTAFDSISWPKPNARVQWQIDTGSGYYIRFDGYIDAISGGKYVNFSDDTYHIQYTINCKARWRDAEFSIFTGSYALDGMTRSEAYTLLAEQMGLDTATELDIGTLTNDTTLPQAESGEKKSLLTRIGENVLEVFKDVQKFYSVKDEMFFRDDGTGTVKLFIQDESDTNIGTIIRSNPTQSTPLVVASTGGDNKPQKIIANDKNFFNDIFVIGGDLEYPDKAFVANYRYPPSWQDTSDLRYIRKRRILIAISPAWQSQGIVNLVGLALFNKFCKFDVVLSVNGFLLYNAYPGQVVTLDAGGESGAVDTDYRIKSMQTQMLKLNRPLSRRYATTYELELL